MGVFSRSWELTKLSFSVIRQDKELLIFPFLSALFSLAVLGAFWFPVDAFILSGHDRSSATIWGLTFLLYFTLTLCSTFFSVCAVHIIKKRLEGGQEGLADSFSFAFSRMHLIVTWSLLSATVSTLLKMLESVANNGRGNNPLSLIVSVIVKLFVFGLELSWSIVTLFVIPAMVYKNLSPWDAVKDSTEILRKTWGESLVRSYGLGFIQLLTLFGGLGVLALLAMGISSAGSASLLVALGAVGVAYLCVNVAVFSMANTVFNTALYAYAATGEVPQGYRKDLLESAFKTK